MRREGFYKLVCSEAVSHLLCLCLAPFILLKKWYSVFPSGSTPLQLILWDLEEADPTLGDKPRWLLARYWPYYPGRWCGWFGYGHLSPGINRLKAFVSFMGKRSFLCPLRWKLRRYYNSHCGDRVIIVRGKPEAGASRAKRKKLDSWGAICVWRSPAFCQICPMTLLGYGSQQTPVLLSTWWIVLSHLNLKSPRW